MSFESGAPTERPGTCVTHFTSCIGGHSPCSVWSWPVSPSIRTSISRPGAGVHMPGRLVSGEGPKGCSWTASLLAFPHSLGGSHWPHYCLFKNKLAVPTGLILPSVKILWVKTYLQAGVSCGLWWFPQELRSLGRTDCHVGIRTSWTDVKRWCRGTEGYQHCWERLCGFLEEDSQGHQHFGGEPNSFISVGAGAVSFPLWCRKNYKDWTF